MNVGEPGRRLSASRRTEIAGILRAVGRKLSEVAQSTERDFLAVGGKLESIVTRAGEAVAALAGVAEAVGGEPGHALAGALDEVATWTVQASRCAECDPLLAHLIGVVRSVAAPLRDLQRAVRTLRVMGVVTRVETARLGDRAAGFRALAGETGDLAEGVEEKAEAILSAVEGLCKLLERTRRTAAEQERLQQGDLLRLVEACAAGLRDLSTRQERVRKDSRGVEAGYREVMRRVGDVVLGVQIHDSTRQRFEHVQEALTGLAAYFASGAGAAEALTGVALQEAHLREAQEVFLTAVATIKTELEAIGESFAGLAWTARALGEGEPGAAVPFDREIERDAAGIRQAIEEWVASRRALGAAAGEVNRACARMTGFVAEIESVGDRMLRLALNAEIQAVHLAASGVVMEAVAEGIRGISQQASSSAAATGGLLREVERAAGRLSTVLGTGIEGQRAGELASRTCRLAEEVCAASAAGRRLLHSLAGHSDKLAGDIQALRGDVVADRVLAGISADCLDALAKIAVPVRAGKLAERRPALSRTEGRYTMHAERHVHDVFTGAGAIRAAVEVPEAASEFGANVELF